MLVACEPPVRVSSPPVLLTMVLQVSPPRMLCAFAPPMRVSSPSVLLVMSPKGGYGYVACITAEDVVRICATYEGVIPARAVGHGGGIAIEVIDCVCAACEGVVP